MSIVGALLGSYRVTDELSAGGMGAVYRAHHELLGRPAAVKVLRPELTENPELVQRFFTEARAATAIRHPGIVEVFDFGYTGDGRAYLVMELLDGESLADRIDRGRLAELDAARIARGIASALGAAHAKGIVHRDLKPDNVMIVADPERPDGERAKVLDFGIAKLADPTGAPLASDSHPTQTGALIGTPLYMAPEQARAASAIDHRADLYSLGCMLYEMLVGAPPFEGVGAGEIIAMQLFGEVVPPRTRVPQISRELDAIVLRLLEKDPAARFQSAAELSAALDRTFAQLGPSPSLEMPAVAARPRRSALPLIAGLVTLAIVAGGAIVLATGGGAAAPAPPPPAPPPAIEIVRQPAPPPPVQQPPPPVVQPVDPGKPKAVTPRTPRKAKPCDGHKGEHTDNCSPIETRPL